MWPCASVSVSVCLFVAMVLIPLDLCLLAGFAWSAEHSTNHHILGITAIQTSLCLPLVSGTDLPCTELPHSLKARLVQRKGISKHTNTPSLLPLAILCFLNYKTSFSDLDHLEISIIQAQRKDADAPKL